MAGDLYTSKAKAEKAAVARRNIFRREYKKAVARKEPDAKRYQVAIKTVRVRKLSGLPKLYEVAGQ